MAELPESTEPKRPVLSSFFSFSTSSGEKSAGSGWLPALCLFFGRKMRVYALGPAATTSALMWVYFLKFSIKLAASFLQLAA